jgi:hypothetical protein
MPIEVQVNATARGHFPVFEDDGYTKHSGLLLSDFEITTYFNNVPTAVPVTLSEIGLTGEYEYSYDLQILNKYNYDIEAESFQCVDITSIQQLVNVKFQCDKIDLIPTLGPSTATSGSLLDRIANKDVNKTYNQGTDSLEAIRDRSG